MPSKVASALALERLRKNASLTPAERVAMAERLGEESLAVYMASHGVDRRAAIAHIKTTRRLGRRHSRSASR